MLNIQERTAPTRFALFRLGFRPFFLGAGLFGALSMVLWLLHYSLRWHTAGFPVAGVWWHSHEMIYGYSLAVIAGFLLTAVKNWTGVQTWHGWPLAGLFAIWLLARTVGMLPLPQLAWLMALADLGFMLLLILAVAVPIWRARQWGQLGIILVLLMLLLGNLLFYASVLQLRAFSPRVGIYLGLYFVIAMILVMGRRVIPFFIEKGVAYPLKLHNWLWLDIAVLIVFIVFALLEVFLPEHRLIGWLAAALLILNGMRLYQWHSPGIWRKPLLWILYLAYGFIVLGFGLKFLSSLAGLSPLLAMHAFAAGGIGLMTVGMMSRVALGHTGRNVFEPPVVLIPIFVLLLLAGIARVFLPLLLPRYYADWIILSQLFWISGFVAFCVVYVPILLKPRIDGQYG